jgi:hypothetical protein
VGKHPLCVELPILNQVRKPLKDKKKENIKEDHNSNISFFLSFMQRANRTTKYKTEISAKLQIIKFVEKNMLQPKGTFLV